MVYMMYKDQTSMTLKSFQCHSIDDIGYDYPIVDVDGRQEFIAGYHTKSTTAKQLNMIQTNVHQVRMESPIVRGGGGRVVDRDEVILALLLTNIGVDLRQSACWRTLADVAAFEGLATSRLQDAGLVTLNLKTRTLLPTQFSFGSSHS